MDKSFNDEELSDIMKEIEALEDDFSSPVEMSATPVLEELAEMDEERSVPASTANVVPLEKKSAGSSMSFNVEGDLKLDLQFNIGGKVVSLGVSESGLSIEMEGGVKFSVPVPDKASHKKAA